MNIYVIIGMLGGLGLFLFGIQMMASGMQKVAGDRLRRILEILTTKPVIGVLTGILVTVLVQSSSTTTVMLVGFVNAGLMSLSQAVGAIMGANIGTTITAQVISFELDFLALPAIGIGGLINFFGRRKLYRYMGQSILGFGLLFLGMITMSDAMSPLRDNPVFLDLLVRFAENPLLAIMFSALFTAAIQSSSGATGIIIALTLQELVTLEAAIPLILGTNVGTCITVVIAGLGTSLSARRAAVAHILFNLLGVGIILLFLGPFTDIVLDTGQTVARQTANAHTFFNLLNTLVMFPFFKLFVRFVEFVVPGEERTLELGPKYLDKRILKAPEAGIKATRQEMARMATVAREMVGEAIDVFHKGDRKKINQVMQKEELIDGLETEIYLFLQELSQHSLTRQQTIAVSGLMSAANDLERMGDHSQNVLELAEMALDEKMHITDTAKREVYSLYEKVDDMMEKAIKAFTEENGELAREVVREDDVVDNMEKQLRNNHIDRVTRGECSPGAGVIYLDILSNLERIADHATNLAQIVLGEH